MRGIFEGARTIKPGQKWLRELFKGAVFSRARSDQGNTVNASMAEDSESDDNDPFVSDNDEVTEILVEQIYIPCRISR